MFKLVVFPLDLIMPRKGLKVTHAQQGIYVQQISILCSLKYIIKNNTSKERKNWKNTKIRSLNNFKDIYSSPFSWWNTNVIKCTLKKITQNKILFTPWKMSRLGYVSFFVLIGRLFSVQ